MKYRISYPSNDDELVIGWGLCLRHICGESKHRSYVGCQAPEDAVALFVAESPDFSEDDIDEVVPILDFRSSNRLLAVTSGDYSDYTIWAVFDDREKANKYKEQLALMEYNVKIKTLPLNPDPPDVVSGIDVWMHRDGESEPVRPARHFRARELGFSAYNYSYDDGPVLIWRVRTENARHAIKVVNEVRAQLIAAGAWGNTGKTRDWDEARKGIQ